jgi:hypothetical protein
MDFPILTRVNGVITTILVKNGKEKCAVVEGAVFDSIIKFRDLVKLILPHVEEE